jgi:class 3 adenylate cyclase
MDALVRGLVSRADPVRAGRVIPDHGDLPIGAGRQLDATVMFLDICGSSARGSDLPHDQSRMLLALTILFAEMIRVIEDHGGTVEKNTGDGLMAYFASGEPGQSTQTTAVSAALTMTAASTRLIDPLLNRIGTGRLPFRICLDHGPITVAEVGAARGFRGIVAIGSTANIASKMLALAGTDKILIGQSVRDGLPANWAVHAHGPIETGFSYAATGTPYYCYDYQGRWTPP